jgi:hypothetical protein
MIIQLVLEGSSPGADEVPNRLKILLHAGAEINRKSDTGQALVVVAVERLRREKPLADTNIPRLSDGTLAALLEGGAVIEDLDEHMLGSFWGRCKDGTRSGHGKDAEGTHQ